VTSVAAPQGGLVVWTLSERQAVALPREAAEWIDHVAEAFDAIPFAWPGYPDGWIFVLMPRRPTVYA
jgi:hypothetical protein